MRAQEIVPGLYRIPILGGYTAAFLLVSDGEVVLVDSGVRRQAPRILCAIARTGRKPEEITSIIVTHAHADHVGSLGPLAEATRARVAVHPEDAGVVRTGGPLRIGRGTTTGSRILMAVVSPFVPRRVPPARVDREISDGEALPGGLRVLHTPGHTPGHVSLLWERHGGVLIGGDAAGAPMGRPSLPIVAVDMDAMRASIARLATLEFETACFTHGKPIVGGASATFRRFAERL